MITGKTRLLAIIGDPIDKARSPESFCSLLELNGHDAIMIPVHVTSADLPPVLAGLKAMRNLDGIVSPIEVLPEIVDAVGKRATIFMDSGIRRGSDVVKALALGAHAVMVGRSTLYGVAAGGEAGASRALAIYRDEIHRNMAILGCNTIADIGPQCLLFADKHELRAPKERPALRVVAEAKSAES